MTKHVPVANYTRPECYQPKGLSFIDAHDLDQRGYEARTAVHETLEVHMLTTIPRIIREAWDETDEDIITQAKHTLMSESTILRNLGIIGVEDRSNLILEAMPKILGLRMYTTLETDGDWMSLVKSYAKHGKYPSVLECLWLACIPHSTQRVVQTMLELQYYNRCMRYEPILPKSLAWIARSTWGTGVLLAWAITPILWPLNFVGLLGFRSWVKSNRQAVMFDFHDLIEDVVIRTTAADEALTQIRHENPTVSYRELSWSVLGRGVTSQEEKRIAGIYDVICHQYVERTLEELTSVKEGYTNPMISRYNELIAMYSVHGTF